MTQSKRDEMAEEIAKKIDPMPTHTMSQSLAIAYFNAQKQLQEAAKSGYSAGRNEAIEEVLELFDPLYFPIKIIEKIKSLKEKV